MEINEKNTQFKNDETSDEINLKFIFNILLRNKNLVVIFAVIFFLLACLISISKRRVWEGQFDIVLSTTGPLVSNPLEFNSSSISRLGNLSLNSRKLNTEIGILESQSILMPAYEFLKKEKSKLYKNKKNSLLFSDWKKSNIRVKLQRNTTILSFFYRDKDKDLVIPVLSKISNLYQVYSGSKKKRNSELTKTFLKQQIAIYKDKSKNSFKEAQSYAIDQDLSDIDFYQENSQPQISSIGINSRNSNMKRLLNFQNPSSTSSRLSVSIPNIAIENARVRYANRLKNIDEQIKKINEIGNDPDKLQYFGSTIPALVQENLPMMLSEIEERLTNLRAKYTDKKRSIIRLTEERNLLTRLLKKRAIGYLQAERLQVQAKMLATTRPKEVILKYKELVREAGRDESILIDLENKLRLMDLDEKRIYDPWKLITQPTMLEYPVAPNRKQYGLVGLIIGLFIGSIISWYKEKISGLVFESEIIEKKFKTQVLDEINLNKDKYDDEKIVQIRDLINIDVKQKTFILTVGEISLEDITKLKELLIISDKQNLKNEFPKISSNFKEFVQAENRFILAKLDTLKYIDIEAIDKRINMLNLNIKGILIIKD